MHKNFVKIENIKDWQNLLEKVLFKTFFHNIEWEEFLESQFNWLKFERYVWPRLAGQALLSLARVGNKLISHPFCEYGGPLPLVGKIDGREFQKDLLEEFKTPFKISFHPHLLNYFDVTRSDCVTSGKNNTYFVEGFDRKSPGQFLSCFRKTMRHSIEKYTKKNLLEIGKCSNEDELRSFYKIYLDIEKRHKTIPYPFSFFEFFFKSLYSEIILAKHQNKIIAGSIFLFYDKFIHYFKNASDKKYDNLGANYLILWHQIQRYTRKEHGGWGHGNYEIFDLGGTRSGSSLEIFKRGWGGKKSPIYELKNYSGESSLRKSKLRDIFGLLPVFLIKKLSPYLLKYKL